jgi:DNA repair protein RecN (Recombination protein N)
MLSNAEEIKEALSSVSFLIESEEFSVLRNLKECAASTEKIAKNLPAASEISRRLESCRIEIKDIEQEVSVITDKIIVSPERTRFVEERISEIYRLLNKHHLSTVSDLINLRDSLAGMINKTGSDIEAAERLEKQTVELRKRRAQEADLLHTRRESAAKEFSHSIRNSVRELEMPHAQFDTKLTRRESYGETGNSSVTLFFSANREVEARELGKVASGGELSRIMLCLKAILAKESGMPTMIFDEIDAGVSGSIADKMGRLISEMAKEMQIFAITHLPQIASKGKCHLLVYKESEEGTGTRTLIRRVDGEERVKEIARMLSGTKTTTAALANAEELLSN